MASDKEYKDFILEQLGSTVTARAMMGEFTLYDRGKIIGGIYDNRLLLKPVPAALALTPNPKSEIPYPGAKPMLLIEEVDDREFLQTLTHAMWDQLPPPKKGK